MDTHDEYHKRQIPIKQQVMNVPDWEARVKRDDHDTALIQPRVEAFRALDEAHKSGDARRVDDVKARLGELAASELEEF